MTSTMIGIKDAGSRTNYRRLIVDAARAEIAAVGRDGFSAKNVAVRANVHYGSMVRMFPAKADLLAAVQPVGIHGVDAVYELHCADGNGLCRECATQWPCRTLRALQS